MESNNRRRKTKSAAAAPRRRVKAPSMRRDQIIAHPPQLPSYGITRDVRMRFQATAAGAITVTFQNLLDTVLVALTAILGVDLFESVRVNSVELWGIAALGTPTTVILVYNGTVLGAQGDQKTHTDTSMGIEPAHVKARPDRLTQAGQFQASSANSAFFIDVSAGAVIDVSMTFRQPVQGQSVAPQNALVGATPGAVYYRGLDGKTVALTNFPVVGALSAI